MILNENENAGMQNHFHEDVFFQYLNWKYKTTIFISVAAHFLCVFDQNRFQFAGKV
jgi:hypothetical protein